jgi:CRISPR-associated protein Cmr4
MADRTANSTARRLLGLLAETSVHAGVGAQVGAVDLPIQRERHTGWPTIYGSGLKGVLRDEARAADWDAREVEAVFGPDPDPPRGSAGEQPGAEPPRHAGALAISDARILLFPVRAAGLPFAWVTSPLALARLGRDALHAGLNPVPQVSPTGERVKVSQQWPRHADGAFLEDVVFEAEADRGVEELGKWIAQHLLPSGGGYEFWRQQLPRSLAVVGDEDFTDFVRHATEIVTRVRLERERKTVQEGALWTEEHLPSDSLLYAFAAAWRPNGGAPGTVSTPEQVMRRVAEMVRRRPVVQVGGKETVGRGFVALRVTEGNHAQAE